MKKYIFSLLFAAILCGYASENLFPGSDLTLCKGGWRTWPGGGGFAGKVSKTADGATEVKINPTGQASIITVINLKPRTTYKASFRYSQDQEAASGQKRPSFNLLYRKAEGAANGSSGQQKFDFPASSSTEWQTLKFEFTTNEQTNAAQFGFTFNGCAGTYQFADLSLTEVGDHVALSSGEAVLTDFYRNEIIGKAGLPDAETKVRLSFDDKALRITFDNTEPFIKNLKAKHRKVDAPLWEDDCNEVFIAIPEGRCFQFIVNANGARHDAERFLSEQGNPFISNPKWNGDWQASAKVGENSWSSEFIIPYSALGLNGKPAKLLVNFARERYAGVRENSHWQRSGENFGNFRKYAVLELGSNAAITRFTELHDIDPFKVARPQAKFKELQSDEPGNYIVGSWAHDGRLALYPEAFRKENPDPKKLFAEYSAEIGDTGMFSIPYPWITDVGGIKAIADNHKQYGTKIWWNASSSWHRQKAIESGRARYVSQNSKPGAVRSVDAIDPVYHEIIRQAAASYIEKEANKLKPYMALVEVIDEPMGYATFSNFSRTLQPENKAVLDETDREIKAEFGSGKYGLYDFHGPKPADRVEGNLSRIAFIRWWNKRAAEEAAKDLKFFHENYSGIPVITYNFCFMYGMNYIDVPLVAAATDITSADPYPTATISHFGRERALYQTGFSTKYLKDLSHKPTCIMPQGFIYCGMAPTPERIREWASQALKNGAEVLFWYTDGPFRYTCPDAYKEMLRVNKLAHEMNRLKLPETRTGIFVSYPSMIADQDKAQHQWYSLYALMGEKLKRNFRFVADSSLELGIDDLSNYKLLFVPRLNYADTATAGKLVQYVKKGGILVIFDPDFLTTGTDGSSLEKYRVELLGAKPGAAVNHAQILLPDGTPLPLLPQKNVDNEFTGKVMARATSLPADARLIARFPDNSPAAFSRQVGKGTIYYYSAQPFGDSTLSTIDSPWVKVLETYLKMIDEPVTGIWDFLLP